MDQKPHALTEAEVALVQSSFRLIAEHAPAAAARFFAHLFRLDPALRRLFHGGMVEQGKKFMDMLGFVAARMHDFGQLRPVIRELGVRHAGYHVEERHYVTARQALLDAYRDILRDKFDTPTRTAWENTYDLLATTMQEAAREAAAVRSTGPAARR